MMFKELQKSFCHIWGISAYFKCNKTPHLQNSIQRWHNVTLTSGKFTQYPFSSVFQMPSTAKGAVALPLFPNELCS